MAWQLEVITVKRKSLDQMPLTLGLKATDLRAAHLAVMLPVSNGNAFKHGLVDGEDLLVTFRDSHAVLKAMRL